MNTQPEDSPRDDTEDLAFLPSGAAAMVQGASRGIGLAFVERLLCSRNVDRVFATCRNPENATRLTELEAAETRLTVLRADVTDEDSLAQAKRRVEEASGRLDLLINCSGLLHEAPGVWPERQLADVDAVAVDRAFRVNAIGPLLVFKAFEALLKRGTSARVATLSARVGSIGDNRLGGWYAYRASKAALNQLIRTTSIQWARLPRPITCVALHPGTVDTDLSAPFTGESYRGRVFGPDLAARQLLSVIGGLSTEDSGGFFAWDGQPIPW